MTRPIATNNKTKSIKGRSIPDFIPIIFMFLNLNLFFLYLSGFKFAPLGLILDLSLFFF